MISFQRFVRVTMAWCLLVPLVDCHAQEVRSEWSDGWLDPAPHRSTVVSVNGASLAVLDWGGAGPPLVFLHGSEDNAHVFDDLAPLLSDEFRVIAYSRRGHGRSSKQGPYDTATMTEDLRQLLDSLRLDRVGLAGWSSGGNEVTAFARQYPGRVAHIIYLDAVYQWGYDQSPSPTASLPVEGAPPPSAFNSVAAYRDWYLRTWTPTVRETHRLEAYIRGLLAERGDGTVAVLAPDSLMSALRRGFAPRRYDGIGAPVLAILAQTYVDTLRGEPARRARFAAWERERLQPFRARSVAELLKVVPKARVITVAGVHGDFVFTSRDAVAAAIREFAAPRP